MEHDRINIEEFCRYYSAEISFVHSLHESGLIHVDTDDDHYFISIEEMPRVEKFVRMHYDLDINLPGLETIDYLLRKMESLQNELKRLQDISTSA